MKHLVLVLIALIAGVVYLHVSEQSDEPAVVQVAPITEEQSQDPEALLSLAFDSEPSFSQKLDVESLSGNDKISHAFKNRLSNVQVKSRGKVIRLLADDNDGSRHQRFILRLSNNQTILIAHNIDLASRVNSLRKGDMIEFYGEYEWNDKGGVVHWTHKDPNKSHPDGYLKYSGLKYW